MKVEQLMNKPAVACGPEASLADAAMLMWTHDIGCVAVADPGGRLLGMITDRDICMAALHAARPLAALKVAAVMSRDIATCRPVDSVQAAEQQMAGRQVRRLPVVDAAGRLVGLVSLNDLARASVGARQPDGAEVEEVAQTYAAIGRPRSQRPALSRF